LVKTLLKIAPRAVLGIDVDQINQPQPMTIQGSPEQVVMPSCQRKLASRIGLTADVFSRPGFRLAPETAPAFPVLPPSMAVAPE